MMNGVGAGSQIPDPMTTWQLLFEIRPENELLACSRHQFKLLTSRKGQVLSLISRIWGFLPQRRRSWSFCGRQSSARNRPSSPAKRLKYQIRYELVFVVIDRGYRGKMMTDLIEKLKEIAVRANESDAPFIERAIDRIEELEAELTGHKEDITNWQVSVEKQMRRRKDDKWKRSGDRWRQYRLESIWHPGNWLLSLIYRIWTSVFLLTDPHKIEAGGNLRPLDIVRSKLQG